MGWAVLAVAWPLFALLPTAGLVWLVAGAACYTGGVAFFLMDSRLKFAHSIWHLFVLGFGPPFRRNRAVCVGPVGGVAPAGDQHAASLNPFIHVIVRCGYRTFASDPEPAAFIWLLVVSGRFYIQPSICLRRVSCDNHIRKRGSGSTVRRHRPVSAGTDCANRGRRQAASSRKKPE